MGTYRLATAAVLLLFVHVAAVAESHRYQVDSSGGNGIGFGSVDGKVTVSEQYGAKRTTIQIGQHAGFILHPAKATTEKRPWAWYAPTIGSHPNQNNGW